MITETSLHSMPTKFLGLAAVVASSLLPSLHAEIVVEGVQDRQVVSDRVTFRVIPSDGFVDEARLDGSEIICLTG